MPSNAMLSGCRVAMRLNDRLNEQRMALQAGVIMRGGEHIAHRCQSAYYFAQALDQLLEQCCFHDDS